MNTKPISIRFSLEEIQAIEANAVKHSGYFLPGGTINKSKYIRDRALGHDVITHRVEGIEKLDDVAFQLKKLGANFNQTLNQIHVERHNSKMEGHPSEAALNKYETLNAHYSDLKIAIDSANKLMEVIKDKISKIS